MKSSSLQLARLLLLFAVGTVAFAQPAGVGADSRTEVWAPFGNRTIIAGVAGAASGPVERAWFGENEELFAMLPGGKVFRDGGSGAWSRVDRPDIPAVSTASLDRTNDLGLYRVVEAPVQRTRVYALGDQVFRSDDNGITWTGLTKYRGLSLLGDELNDIAIHPTDPDEVVVSSDLGLWRSRDGGLSWYLASAELPGLHLRRILTFPEGTRGLRAEMRDGRILEWIPGSVRGWQLQWNGREALRREAPEAISRLGSPPVDWAVHGAQIYVSLEGGTVLSSSDSGETWRGYSLPGISGVSGFQIDPRNSAVTVALALREDGTSVLLRTLNGGIFWDDWTPAGQARMEAVAPSWETGVLYAIAGGDLFRYSADIRSATRPRLENLYRFAGSPGNVTDLRLDPSGTVLFAATDGSGIYTMNAPYPGERPIVRNAANLASGPATPGALLSIYGQPIRKLSANGREAALLGDSDGVTQVQLPYALGSGRVELDLETDTRTHVIELPLRRAAPAIFVQPDGNPFVLRAETETFMDENHPLIPGEVFHVLVTGLGAVSPDWPAGQAASVDAPPVVVARVEATINGLPAQVTRATLAPGYAGIYLVEVRLPGVMDEGVAELRILADGAESNRVAIHVAY